MARFVEDQSRFQGPDFAVWQYLDTGLNVGVLFFVFLFICF